MDFPDVIRIEPAGLCNFKCRHCPVGTEGGKRSILTYEMFMRFFNMLPLVPRVLVLYHGGEPLLNKSLEKMIAYAKDRGVHKVVFNTNASLLNSERDLSRLDELRVSFDGASAEENNAIRVGSKFERHALRVRILAESKSRPKQITIFNAGNGRIPEYLLDYFEGCDVVFRAIKMKQWARRDAPPQETNGAAYCQNLFETFTILANGDVPMCCEDLLGEDIQGNVFQNSPLEIWRKMGARRSAFAMFDYPKLCRSCWRTTWK